MFDVMNLSLETDINLAQTLVEVGDFADIRQPRFDAVQILHFAQREEHFLNEVSARIAGDGHVRNVGKRGTRIGGHLADGPLRKARPMLDAIEALLLDAADKLAIVQDGGGGVTMKSVQAENLHGAVLLRSSSMLISTK